MAHAFSVHNEFGRFMDEPIYSVEMAMLCLRSGLDVMREVRLQVSFQDFVSDYYIDLVVGGGAIYELKTVDQLTGRNEGQLINYLLLAEQFHGKLINYRPPSVESRFVSTRLTFEKRRAHTFRSFAGNAEQEVQLEEVVRCLLDDWGAFLELDLYKKAILHFVAGKDFDSVQSVDIVSNGRVLGKQNFCLLDDCSVLHVSAIPQGIENYEKHVNRLLRHTALEKVQWLNFDGPEIVLKTIRKS